MMFALTRLLLSAAVAAASLRVSGATSLRGNRDAVGLITFQDAMEQSQSDQSPRLLAGGICVEEFAWFQACIAGLTKGIQCGACVSKAEQSMYASAAGVSCDEYEEGMCTALESCGCKSCSDEIEKAMNCVADNNSGGVCEVDCGAKDGVVHTGGRPRVKPKTERMTDICYKPLEYVYGADGKPEDVDSCTCSEDRIKDTVDVVCTTTDGRSKYFKFKDGGKFDLYLETPAANDPSIEIAVINDVAFQVCGVLPTDVKAPTAADSALSTVCRSCEMCEVGDMVGVKYNCHDLSSNVCNPIFSSSIL